MLETGIPNLDLVLGGGIPKGDTLLIIGLPGSGKTTLSLQMAFHAATRGQKAIYVSTLGEPPARLIRHMRSFSFFDESLGWTGGRGRWSFWLGRPGSGGPS